MKDKLLQIKNKLSDNKKRAVAWLLVGSLVLGLAPIPKTTVNAVESVNPIPEEGGYFTETNTGDMNRVPYNNEGLTVDLSASIFGTVLVADNNADNVLDIIISTTCEGIPVASHVFYGKTGAQDVNSENYMVMEKAVAATGNKSTAEQAYGTCVYNAISGENSGYKNTYKGTIVTQSAWTHGTGASWPWANNVNYTLPGLSKDSTAEEIEVYQKQLKYADNTSVTLLKPGKKPDGSSYSFADYDGDGDLDLIYSINSWVDFGWSYGTPAEYDNNGIWDTDGDGKEDRIHGFVFWFENTREYAEGTALWDTRGTTATPPIYGEPQVIMVYDEEGNANPLDTYSHPEAKMYDFDNDGDLDIACGSWIDEITYYENVQVQENLDMPKFKEGRPFVDADGNAITAEHMELSIAAVDWNNDGWMDLVVSQEDTRVFLLEHTGKIDEDTNTPIMSEPKWFQQEADSVKVDAMSTPYSIDWDGDGDEDLISGDSSGFISFVENLSIIKDEETGEFKQVRDLSDPSWDKPVRFKTSDGEDYHITARMEGVYGIEGIVDGSYAGNYGSIQGPAEQCFGYTKLSVADWDRDGILDIMSNNVRGEIYVLKGTADGWTTIDTQEMVKVEWNDDDGDGTPDPKLPAWYNRPYDQRKYYAEAGYLIGPWRTTPFMVDLPRTDTDGDGVAEGDDLTDLVMLDHEGYLAFFERYRDTETNELKLKEGKRIFKDTDGSELGLRADTAYETYDDGKSGRRLFTMVDYDLDGDLDLIVDDQVNRWNIEYRENISTTPGEYKFAAPYSMHTRNYAYHTPCPTVCDWNQDGIPDVLVGTEAGYLYYLKNTVVKTPEESLVAHWDFEGDTQKEMLEDKATAGEAENNLTVKGTPGNVSMKGGVATITGDGYLMTPDQADLDRNGEMTIFMRAFVNGSGGDSATTSLINKGNGSDGYNYSINASDWTHTNFNLECDISAKRYQSAGYIKENILPRGEWREIAFVISEEADGYYYQIFLSNAARTGSVEDFEIIKEKTYIGSQIRVNSDDLLLGIESDLTANTSTRKIDDVRIYNTALTVKQLVTLLPEVNIEENLVAHWDFEGDASTTALEDKATAGIADNLDIGGTTGNITIEDGIATLKGDGAFMADDSTDLAPSSKMTIFMKAYIEGSGEVCLINKAGSNYNSRMAYKLDVRGDGRLNLILCKASWDNPEYGEDGVGPERDTWREIAIVLDQNKDGYVTVKAYVSKDIQTSTGADFKLLWEHPFDITEPLNTSLGLTIGNGYVAENQTLTLTDSGVTRKFDDVRIYNTALTTEQLAGLITVEEEEYNLDNGAYNLSTVGTNVWVNGEKVTETLLNKSGEYEIAVGTESNLVKRVLLYRPGNANIPVDESTDVIDVRDLVAIIKASDGIELSSKAAKRGADVNGDSKVNDTDKGQLRNMLLK